MTTRQLLPIFVLAIEALAPLGCGSHQLGDASNVAAMSGSYLAGDVDSYSAEGRTAHFMLLNSRQHVLSSGIPWARLLNLLWHPRFLLHPRPEFASS